MIFLKKRIILWRFIKTRWFTDRRWSPPAPTPISVCNLVLGLQLIFVMDLPTVQFLVRIPEKRRERRFEFRGADGTCNPYLLTTCLLAAGLDGIKNKIEPGEPMDMDCK